MTKKNDWKHFLLSLLCLPHHNSYFYKKYILHKNMEIIHSMMRTETLKTVFFKWIKNLLLRNRDKDIAPFFAVSIWGWTLVCCFVEEKGVTEQCGQMAGLALVLHRKGNANKQQECEKMLTGGQENTDSNNEKHFPLNIIYQYVYVVIYVYSEDWQHLVSQALSMLLVGV